MCVYTHTHTHTYTCLVAQSCLTLCNPMDCSLPGSSVHEYSPGKNTGMGCHALLQGIFPTPGIEPSSPALQVDSLPSEPPGKPNTCCCFLVTKSCPALHDPMDCSMPGFPIKCRCVNIYILCYIYIHTQTYMFFTYSLHYRLLEEVEYCSLCYTVGPCCLSSIYFL